MANCVLCSFAACALQIFFGAVFFAVFDVELSYDYFDLDYSAVGIGSLLIIAVILKRRGVGGMEFNCMACGLITSSIQLWSLALYHLKHGVAVTYTYGDMLFLGVGLCLLFMLVVAIVKVLEMVWKWWK